jgi:hypothetical protein
MRVPDDAAFFNGVVVGKPCGDCDPGEASGRATNAIDETRPAQAELS